MKRIISIILMLVLALSVFTACDTPQSDDLMENINPNPEIKNNVELSDVSNVAVTDFAVRLFGESLDYGNNTLISPLSVLVALSMTANGADNETLTQLEAVLGMPIEQINSWIKTYMDNLPEEEKYKLSLANSIWFKDTESFTVNEDFLQTNADYYGAGIYKAPFDKSTLKEINKWVEDNTDGMIKDILDEIPPEAIMYLVNALAFDAEWQNMYKENQIRDGQFTTQDKTKQDIELMYSSENSYLEDDKATGFIKYYKDRKFAFAALLPNEDVTVEEYVASLDGEHLNELLKNAEQSIVSAAIPKFETEYKVEMKDILTEMGMPNAFSDTLADFSKIGKSTDGNICISRVIHQTYINVDAKGTKAGAATVVEMKAESAMEPIEPPKQVFLDRPFVYMLIDCETNIPFFIGAMMDVDGVAVSVSAEYKEFIDKARDIEKYSKENLESAATQLDLNTQSYNVYLKWDSLLSEVYEYLKQSMTPDDFSAFRKQEEEWKEERDKAMEAEALKWQGGSGEPLARNLAGIQYASKRFYSIVSLTK